MADYAVSIGIDTVVQALGDFLVPYVGSTIIRAQNNRTPMPKGPFTKLTEMRVQPLETPIVGYTAINSQVVGWGTGAIKTPSQIDIQIDFYGKVAGDRAATVAVVWRTAICVSQFPANVKPLMLTDPMQGPLINGEEQYEDRWTVTASLQYNPLVTIPQQFADALSINIIEDLP